MVNVYTAAAFGFLTAALFFYRKESKTKRDNESRKLLREIERRQKQDHAMQEAMFRELVGGSRAGKPAYPLTAQDRRKTGITRYQRSRH